MGSYPPALFAFCIFHSAFCIQMSRWPSSPGSGLQNRSGECDSRTGLHFHSSAHHHSVQSAVEIFQCGGEPRVGYGGADKWLTWLKR